MVRWMDGWMDGWIEGVYKYLIKQHGTGEV
jgi:hypothetical protein